MLCGKAFTFQENRTAHPGSVFAFRNLIDLGNLRLPENLPMYGWNNQKHITLTSSAKELQTTIIPGQRDISRVAGFVAATFQNLRPLPVVVKESQGLNGDEMQKKSTS